MLTDATEAARRMAQWIARGLAAEGLASSLIGEPDGGVMVELGAHEPTWRVTPDGSVVATPGSEP